VISIKEKGREQFWPPKRAIYIIQGKTSKIRRVNKMFFHKFEHI
jgi:hypothetical protein